MAKTVQWIGDTPTKCDICKRPIKDKFVDGRTKMGPWANMCPTCHKSHGYGVGLGCGQMYARQPDETWIKIKG